MAFIAFIAFGLNTPVLCHTNANTETALSAASGNKQVAVCGLYTDVYICFKMSEHQQDVTEHSVSSLLIVMNLYVFKVIFSAHF